MKNSEFIELLKSQKCRHKIAKGGVTVTHNGSVYLDSLTSLPEGTKFENHGYVDLRSLTSLPEGTKFENHGSVYLDSLTGRHTYMGKEREFRHVDGRTMLFTTIKSYGGYTVHGARYFAGGKIADMQKCYVAEGDGLFAHGNTMKSAVEDLLFKLVDHADKAEIAAEVRKSDKVTLAQFRALTGACREGVRHHLQGLGLSLDAIEYMPLDEALKAMSGTSYGEVFAKMVENRA